MEPRRRSEILYANEAARVDFEEMVMDFTDLAEEGLRRILCADREGIRRESSADYALLPREGWAPAWVSPNSLGELSETGFWQSKFIRRFDATFKSGLISRSMKSGMSFPPSTYGKAARLSTGIVGVGQYPTPGMLGEENIKSRYSHAHMEDGRRISWDRI